MTTHTTPHDAFKVDAELEAEFQKALHHQLTDDDIEKARLLLGIDTASRYRELNSVATEDAIRNWALGVGDDNPLYVEEEYGRATRWGSQIGHGTQMGHIKTPMLGDPIATEIKERTKGMFRGVHVFVSGGTWEWYRPLRPGDRIYSFRGEDSLDVKQSEFAGRSVIQVSRDVAINQFGEVLGVYRILRVLTERSKSREKGKYAEIRFPRARMASHRSHTCPPTSSARPPRCSPATPNSPPSAHAADDAAPMEGRHRALRHCRPSGRRVAF